MVPLQCLYIIIARMYRRNMHIFGIRHSFAVPSPINTNNNLKLKNAQIKRNSSALALAPLNVSNGTERQHRKAKGKRKRARWCWLLLGCSLNYSCVRWSHISLNRSCGSLRSIFFFFSNGQTKCARFVEYSLREKGNERTNHKCGIGSRNRATLSSP